MLHTLESLSNMCNELIKNLVCLTICVILQFSSILLGSFENFLLLKLSLTQNGLRFFSCFYDKIIFIDDGRVLAVGSHQELLRTCAPYAELVEMQRLEDERKERE